jgi:hypothetical protein
MWSSAQTHSDGAECRLLFVMPGLDHDLIRTSTHPRRVPRRKPRTVDGRESLDEPGQDDKVNRLFVINIRGRPCPKSMIVSELKRSGNF